MTIEKQHAENSGQKTKHLVRIANTDLDGHKPLSHALKKIKGVGFVYANAVCNIAQIDKSKMTGQLTDEEVSRLNDILKNPEKYGVPSWLKNRRRDPLTNDDKHLVVSDLDFIKSMDIRRMRKIKSYRGTRHSLGLPVRGQRTKSNFRKNKGKGLGVKRKKGRK